MIHWKSRKQGSVTKSSIAVEYVVLSEAVSEILLVKDLLTCLKVMCNPNFNILLNQDSNVCLEKDGCQALRTRKHYMQIFFWMILLVFS